MSTKKKDASSGWRSLIVLCASLVLVYTVFFWYQQPIDPLLQAGATMIEWSYEPAPWAEEDLEVRQEIKEVEAEKSDSAEIAQVQIAEGTPTNPVKVTPTNQIPPTSSHWKQFYSFQELFNKEESSSPVAIAQPWSTRIPLANTYERIWDLRSIVDFGLQEEVEYVLKTVQNTHYVYLWKRDSLTIPQILALWWTVVEIEGKNAINQHSLFGDRVMKISTERYDTKFKKVIFVVFFAQTRDAWFVQVDQDYYENHANGIRSLFDERYDR